MPSELEIRYGVDWPAALKRRMIDLIRTEIRQRHRLAANGEMRRLEEEATKRFWDLIHLGVAPEFDSFEEVEGIVSLSRRGLFREYGSLDGGYEKYDQSVSQCYEGLAAYDSDEYRQESSVLLSANGSKSKHDPVEYVGLAEQGLSNQEIADRLGDVSEASVRRGLRKAGYVRPKLSVSSRSVPSRLAHE